MSDPTIQTECAQIDVLVQAKKDEIAALEERKKEFESSEEWPELKTPAQVAQDPDADNEERVAAANAVLGQDPATVNTEQSKPSPSTHFEQASDDGENGGNEKESVNADAEVTQKDSKEDSDKESDKSKESKKVSTKKS